jgi:hypothetical protein
MSTTSYIGRKVKLTDEYIDDNPKYVRGGINEGTVLDDDGAVWLVKMDNGVKAIPFWPKHSKPQCILLEETNQEAPDRLQLQPGDIVRVISKDNGIHGWNGAMELCMGQPQEVKIIGTHGDVQLWLPDKTDWYWYRPQILEVIERAADRQKTTKTDSINSTAAGHTILDTAKGLIYGDREKEYGSASENFADIATGWSTIVHTAVTPEQVCLMMAWLKICRANKDNGNHVDSLVDCAGYMGCIEKIKKNL